MTDIARGEINIELNDKAAVAGLHALEAQYRAAMARIDRMEAEARVGADTSDLDRDLKKAKDELRILKGERAVVKVKADKKELDRDIKEVEAKIKALDGRKARIQIETRGDQQALANIERITKAEAARAAAEERFARQRQRLAQQEDRNRAAAEKAAMRQTELMRKADLDAAKQQQRVSSLRREWARLSDELEKATAKRTPFGKEARVKLDLDTQFIRSRMEALKAELNFLGGHPPVEIKVDTEAGTFQRLRYKLQRNLANIGDKLANVGNVRLNLGPFSGTIRTMTIAAATLGPILVSLTGAATALVGVVGTGLVGALSVAGGLFTGLAFNIGGVVGAVMPAIKNFKILQQAQDAYNKAVDKYGANSKQAKTAQQQLNSVTKQANPITKQAAKSVAGLATEWHKLTGPTANRDVGRVIKGGADAIRTLMPTLARNTNETTDLLTQAATRWEKAVSSPAGQRIFDSLGKSANSFLSAALPGIDHLAASFAHVAESAARLFGGRAGGGFAKWAADIDKATQPGARLDGTIQRLGDHAADLLHFFSALGSLLITVFNGGADAGDNLLHHMTRALDKWNGFLKTPKGQQDMAKFFQDSADNARALFNVIGPLAAAFVTWSANMTPIITGFLKGAGYVAKFVNWITRLIGLRGGLSTLAATLGAIWAIGKIGAFVSLLARAVTLMRELGAIGTGKALLTGGFLPMLKGLGKGGEGKAVGKAIGRDVGVGLLTGLSLGAGLALGGAALATGGFLALVLTHHTTGTAAAAQEAGKALGQNAGGGAGEAYQKAFDDYMRSHQGFTRGQGAEHYKEVVEGAREAGQRAADQFSQNFTKGITASVNAAMANIRSSRNLNLLAQTPKGQKLVIAIQTSGDKQAQAVLNRLAQTKLGTKLLRIIANGGDEALRQLLVISHTPLGQKIVSIIQRGGPDAQRWVQLLDNARIRAKIVAIAQKGGGDVRSTLTQIAAYVLRDKHFSIRADGGQAISMIQSIISNLNSIPTLKNITVMTHNKSGRAMGGPVFPEEKRLPVLSRDQTAHGARVDRPTLMTGEEHRTEFVIATNPAYRKSNLEYLKMAAQALGVTMARRGKPGRIPKLLHRSKDPDNLPAVKHYRSLQQDETDTNRQISIEESKVKEPDTFIKQVGTDPATGDPIYAPDESSISAYKRQLQNVRDLYTKLLDPRTGIVARLVSAARDAFSALTNYNKDRDANIKSLQATAKIDAKLMHSKDKDTASKAKSRHDKAIQMINDERQKKQDAGSTRKDIQDDQHDLGFRQQEYAVAAGNYDSDIAALPGRAQAEATAANPEAQVTPGTPAEQAIARLQAEEALAEIGQGVGGAAARPIASIINDLIAQEQQRIAEAQALLTDANPANDTQAYQAIQEAAQAIQQLTEQLASTPGTAAFNTAQMIQFGNAREQLYQQFGSNFRLASGFGAVGAVTGAGAFGYNPAAALGSLSGGAGIDSLLGGSGGGANVTVYQNFQAPPPDPHTWSKGIAWDLKAAL